MIEQVNGEDLSGINDLAREHEILRMDTHSAYFESSCFARSIRSFKLS